MSAPQKHVQLRQQLEEKPELKGSKETLNISSMIDDSIANALENIFETTHEQKHPVLTQYLLLFELLKKDEVIKIFPEKERLSDFKEFLLVEQSKLKAITTSSVQGNLYLSPEVKEIILNAGAIAYENKHSFLGIVDLAQAALEHKSISSFFGINNKEVTPQTSPVTIETNYPNFISDLSNQESNTLIGRKNEIELIIRILTREEKNNFILVGEPGVGKKTIIKGLAYLMKKTANVPSFLLSYTPLLIDTSSLLISLNEAGNSIEQFMNMLLEDKQKKLVIFDGIHIDEFAPEKTIFISLVNELIRSKMVIVSLLIDPSQNKSLFDGDPFFKEHFESLIIEQPDHDDLQSILTSKVKEISQKDGILIQENVIPEVISLSQRYIGNEPFPQKALTLLEEASAHAKINNLSGVDINVIRLIVSQKTGIPLTALTKSEQERLQALESELNKVVIGQTYAVKVVSEAIKRSRAGFKDPKKPIGSFLFLGPSGVGKTELAKQLSRIYYQDEQAFVRLDMSEYSESHTSQRLIGSPPGYTGYEEGGQLTNPILKKPYSLILLDEIEKANPKIFDLFLQVLDEGRLSDSRGKLADFRNVILIFTSNLGSQMIFADLQNPDSLLMKDPKKFYQEKLMPELLSFFRPEFLNRFDEVIPFMSLGEVELLAIAKLKVVRIIEAAKEKGIQLVIPDAELAKLVHDAYDPAFGARPLEKLLRTKIENVLADEIIAAGQSSNKVLTWQYQ